jgi:DNA-binding MarR family transcriptional regulator
MALNSNDELGALLEAFVNRVSHPRGRTLSLMSEAQVTLPQVILLNFALTIPDSTPSSLAAIMKISLSSVSQMIERLAKLGFMQRIEDAEDRRRKTIEVTPKAVAFLACLKAVRSEEYAVGTAKLSKATKRLLKEAISRALKELGDRSERPEYQARVG